ncbi:uncharacterized protein [Diadema antillarum]|uniref:uncharacterized protein n=1 Tax=Diadema antillarum TaxID=105358 RepID=UPI003A861646
MKSSEAFLFCSFMSNFSFAFRAACIQYNKRKLTEIRMAATATFIFLATCSIFLRHVQGEAITCWSGSDITMSYEPGFPEEFKDIINMMFPQNGRRLVTKECDTDEWKPACALHDINMTLSYPMDGDVTMHMKLHDCSLETADELNCKYWESRDMRKDVLNYLPRGLEALADSAEMGYCVCDSAKCNESPKTMKCCNPVKGSSRQSKTLGEL